MGNPTGYDVAELAMSGVVARCVVVLVCFLSTVSGGGPTTEPLETDGALNRYPVFAAPLA